MRRIMTSQYPNAEAEANTVRSSFVCTAFINTGHTLTSVTSQCSSVTSLQRHRLLSLKRIEFTIDCRLRPYVEWPGVNDYVFCCCPVRIIVLSSHVINAAIIVSRYYLFVSSAGRVCSKPSNASFVVAVLLALWTSPPASRPASHLTGRHRRQVVTGIKHLRNHVVDLPNGPGRHGASPAKCEWHQAADCRWRGQCGSLTVSDGRWQRSQLFHAVDNDDVGRRRQRFDVEDSTLSSASASTATSKAALADRQPQAHLDRGSSTGERTADNIISSSRSSASSWEIHFARGRRTDDCRTSARGSADKLERPERGDHAYASRGNPHNRGWWRNRVAWCFRRSWHWLRSRR